MRMRTALISFLGASAMFVPRMMTEPESAFCRPVIARNSTLLPVPLRPSTASVSPALTLKLTPSRTRCEPKDLETDSIRIAGSLVCFESACPESCFCPRTCCAAVSLLELSFIGLLDAYFHKTKKISGLREDDLNDFHQDDVG